MPELPEVQTTVNGINKYAKGLRIADVWTDYGSLRYEGKNHIKNKLFFTKFRKEVIGSKIKKAERRAKNVLIELDNGKTILIHMKMTGHVMYGKYQKTKRDKDPWEPVAKTGPLRDPFNKYIRFVLVFFNSKNLVLSDMRRFAKVTLIPTKELFQSDDLSTIGPEPLDKTFTAKVLAERLKVKTNWKIKTTLMDQTVVAGIGNIYSDEILWTSNIHPLSVVSHLKPKDVQAIWKNTKIILRKGIDFGGDSMSDYRNLEGKRGSFQLHHQVYRRTGKPCLKRGCKGIIHRLKVGGRSAHFCPVHQNLI